MAVLARKVGIRNIELVEDAVQDALAAALSTWIVSGPPKDPAAWLYTTAFNRLMSTLRQWGNRLRILEDGTDVSGDAEAHQEAPGFAGEVNDEMLRMLFICCDEAIPPESRLVLALKTLCGFSTPEIALRLFITEANVHKRLARARDRLRAEWQELDTPSLESLASRLTSVQNVLYLLFNEGYLSVHEERSIRRELCEEAIRLTTLLAEHSVGNRPETLALLAVMHLHAARLAARQDKAGGLLLLEEQDRSLWDREQMERGMACLGRAATGESLTRFHVEAGIAAEHCLAPSFGQTRWKEIDALYGILEGLDPSPIHTLNRAVAVAEWRGPEAALSLLEGIAPPSWLIRYYAWDAVLSDLNRRAGNLDLANLHRERALESAPTASVRELLNRRLSVVKRSE